MKNVPNGYWSYGTIVNNGRGWYRSTEEFCKDGLEIPDHMWGIDIGDRLDNLLLPEEFYTG